MKRKFLKLAVTLGALAILAMNAFVAYGAQSSANVSGNVGYRNYLFTNQQLKCTDNDRLATVSWTGMETTEGYYLINWVQSTADGSPVTDGIKLWNYESKTAPSNAIVNRYYILGSRREYFYDTAHYVELTWKP